MVHKELCQHPIKARGFHDVDCNFYRIDVAACQVNARHACLVLITPFDLVQFVKCGLTRDIQDHLNVRVGADNRCLQVRSQHLTPCTQALLWAFPTCRDYIITLHLMVGRVLSVSGRLSLLPCGIVVEPSPLLSHRGAWLLKGSLGPTVAQSVPFSNRGFGFRLAVVEQLSGVSSN